MSDEWDEIRFCGTVRFGWKQRLQVLLTGFVTVTAKVEARVQEGVGGFPFAGSDACVRSGRADLTWETAWPQRPLFFERRGEEISMELPADDPEERRKLMERYFEPAPCVKSDEPVSR